MPVILGLLGSQDLISTVPQDQHERGYGELISEFNPICQRTNPSAGDQTPWLQGQPSPHRYPRRLEDGGQHPRAKIGANLRGRAQSTATFRSGW